MWYRTDELYHHGILGMHWGKRNGPPYPLGASDHSASEKKAGWRKSLDGGSSKKDAKNTQSDKKPIQINNRQLSEKEINKYYKVDHYSDYGTGVYTARKLTEAGYKYNKKIGENANRYASDLQKDIASDKKYHENQKEFTELNKKNNEHYINERKKWLRQEGEYKGKDYYDFKDISRDKWFKTAEGKREREIHNEIEKLIDEKARKNPLYSISMNKLRDDIFTKNVSDITYEDMTYGKYAIRVALANMEREAAKEHKRS